MSFTLCPHNRAFSPCYYPDPWHTHNRNDSLGPDLRPADESISVFSAWLHCSPATFPLIKRVLLPQLRRHCLSSVSSSLSGLPSGSLEGCVYPSSPGTSVFCHVPSSVFPPGPRFSALWLQDIPECCWLLMDASSLDHLCFWLLIQCCIQMSPRPPELNKSKTTHPIPPQTAPLYTLSLLAKGAVTCPCAPARNLGGSLDSSSFAQRSMSNPSLGPAIQFPKHLLSCPNIPTGAFTELVMA